MTTSSAACPPEDELVRMVEGALGDASLVSLESHVDQCEQCAAVVAGLGALESAGARRRQVGRYQLDRRIGGGGMGEVWAAWDPQLRRDIAVKLVKPERADDGRERERLLREARALARLTHPNVLAVYDVGEIDGEVFIATELVIGDTLASRSGANADWRELARLYAQAARGLAAAHAAGLVHRDVKPANLLIGTDGRVRVADFGLAVKSPSGAQVPPSPSPLGATDLASQPAPQITQTGYIAGTPAYMAPEQRLGEPPDARADQYALCLALGEAIAGRRPPLVLEPTSSAPAGTTTDDVLIAFVAERRSREPDLDRLCRVIARGLSLDRGDRFPDATSLADAIDACVATAPASDETPAPHRPRRSLAYGVAGAAAIAGIAIVLGVARLLEEPSPARVATAAARDVTPPAATAGTTSSTNDAALDGAATRANDAGLAAPALAETARRATAADTALPGAAPQATVSTPATRPAPAAPASSEQLDLALAAARRAMWKRDGRACLAALTGIPTNVPVMTQHNVDLHRAQCEMLAGDCDRGIARANAAHDGMGLPQNGAALALSFCPIAGPYEVRRERLTAQAHMAATRESCRSYVAPARTLAREATADRDKVLIGGILRSLARCLGKAGECTEATALWTAGQDLDRIPASWDLPTCPAPAAAATTSAPTPDAVAAISATLANIQRAISARDLKTCRAFLAQPPVSDQPQLQQSITLLQGYCEMLTGDCKDGSVLVDRAMGGKHPDTVRATADTYCPISGALGERLHRIEAQLLAFADRRFPKPAMAWCDHLLSPTRTAASEVRTDQERSNGARVLQHLAWCVSTAGRCTEALELWDLSVATFSGAESTPKLASRCP